MMFFRLLLLLALSAAAAARAQIAVLDNFNNPGATGAVIASPATSWVGNVTRDAGTITVGGTARDDNGWGATGLTVNATNMTHLTVVARRDAGHAAPFVVVELQDVALRTHQISIPAASFATDALTPVSVALGTWPGGFNPAQITGFTLGGGTPPTGLAAFRMTFDQVSLTGALAPTPPTITSQPPDRVIGVDTGTILSVTATSENGPLRYQWKRAGTAIAGATQATLSLANITLAQAGLYQVDVSNDAGMTPSRQAQVSVLDARPSQALATGSRGYVAAGTVTVTATLTHGGNVTALRWSAMLPTGWSFAGDTATTASQRPAAGTLSLIEWAWTSVPASPVTFDFTLNVPIGTEGDRTLTGLVNLTQNGLNGDIMVKPDPLTIANTATRHAADLDADQRINLVELTRLIELYNTRNGTTRTGAYAVASSTTEDGFTPAPTRVDGPATLTAYHSADSNRDGRITLVELTRVIELYNYRQGTTRLGQYHVDGTTEDGFAPGP